jgi:HEAT repeat protein
MQLFRKNRLQALLSEDPKKRSRAAREILNEGEAGAEMLLSAFEESDIRLQKAARQLLLKLGDAALPVLERALREDSSPPVQRGAAETLAAFGTENAFEILIRALKEGTPPQQRLAAEVLGKAGYEKALPHLLVALTAPYPTIRIAAITALEHFRAPEISRHIADLLQDPEIEVRVAAANALKKRGDPSILPDLVDSLRDSFWWYERKGETNALLEAIAFFGAEARDPLLRLMNEKEANVKRYAIRLLARLHDNSLLETFELAFYDTNYDVSETALKALVEFGEEALPILVNALSSPHEWIRQKAVYGLGAIKGDEAFIHLLEMLEDSSPSVRKEAIRVLGERGDPRALPALDAIAAGRSDREISKLARQAIAEIRAAR